MDNLEGVKTRIRLRGDKMLVTEFVVEVENSPGQLAKVARALGGKGINIRAITTERIGGRGYIRFVVDNEEEARKTLDEGGYLYTEMPAILKVLDDKPNTLGEIAHALAREGINIEALYLGTGRNGKAEVVFVLDDVVAGRRILGD